MTPYLELVRQGLITESDLKLIRLNSLDVTHAMKTLREAIEATPEPETEIIETDKALKRMSQAISAACQMSHGRHQHLLVNWIGVMR